MVERVLVSDSLVDVGPLVATDVVDKAVVLDVVAIGVFDAEVLDRDKLVPAILVVDAAVVGGGVVVVPAVAVVDAAVVVCSVVVDVLSVVVSSLVAVTSVVVGGAHGPTIGSASKYPPSTPTGASVGKVEEY